MTTWTMSPFMYRSIPCNQNLSFTTTSYHNLPSAFGRCSLEKGIPPQHLHICSLPGLSLQAPHTDVNTLPVIEVYHSVDTTAGRFHNNRVPHTRVIGALRATQRETRFDSSPPLLRLSSHRIHQTRTLPESVYLATTPDNRHTGRVRSVAEAPPGPRPFRHRFVDGQFQRSLTLE